MARKTFKIPTPTAVEQLKALRTGRLPLTPSEKKSPAASELLKQLPATRLRLQDVRRFKRGGTNR